MTSAWAPSPMCRRRFLGLSAITSVWIDRYPAIAIALVSERGKYARARAGSIILHILYTVHVLRTLRLPDVS